MGKAMMGLGTEVEGVFLFPTLLLISSSLLLVRDGEEAESLFGQWLTPGTHQEMLKAAVLGLKFYPAARGAEKLLQTLPCLKKNQEEIREAGEHGRQSSA